MNVKIDFDAGKRIAASGDVQRHMDHVMLQKLLKAEAILAAHHNEGDAFMTAEQDGLDRLVILNDTRGELHAMSIEYGREPGKAPRWAPWFGRGTPGASILHKTFLGKTAKRGSKFKGR